MVKNKIKVYKKKTSNNKMNKYFLSILFLILLLPLSYSFSQIQTLGTFKQNKCLELKQTCGNCTFNNITSVMYPNSTQALGQVTMTKTGTFYNYTFCNTNTSGQYIVNGFGNPDGINEVWVYDFFITPDGTQITTSQGFLMLGVNISILFFALLFFGASVLLKNNMIKILFISLGVITLVFNLGITIIIVQKYFSTGESINEIFGSFYYLILVLGTAGMILAVVGALIWAIMSYKKKRGFIED